MSNDRPVLGILLMLGFCIVAPLGDAVAKLLGPRVEIGELLLVRFALQAVILVPLVAATGRQWKMSKRVFRLAWLRTLLHMAGIAAMFSALQYMPLADAVSIAFVMPFLMLIFGGWLLGEEVGMRQLLACAAGFVGTLMVIQPSFAEVGWYALLPLVVAFTFSFFILTTRHIAKETDPIGLQAVNGVMATVVILPIVLLGDSFGVGPLALTPLDAVDVSLLAAIGLLGTLAHLLMTWSVRFAPASTLAPIQYLEIPVVTIVGYLIFQDLPNGLATTGIAVTMAAGLYVVMGEQVSQKRRRAEREREVPAGEPAQ